MTPEQQLEILAAGTEEVLPEDALLDRLRLAGRERRPLRVKQGFDPTAPDIHLGHTVGLRKLRQFQELGHQVVLIVGDGTGLVGDPSGRNKTRPELTEEQLEANARTYLEQFYRVVERNPEPPRLPVEVHHNGPWYETLGFKGTLRLLRHFTLSQVLERDDFSKRWTGEQPLGMHELLYPILQGYDSVVIRADVELGATEQKFNLLVGRTLQELHGQRPQVVMTLPVLPGLDGVQRMSKTLGNYVGVADPPAEMFGKLMSVPDGVMGIYWRLVTGVTPQQLARIEAELADPSINPMLIKKRLAHRVVSLYHGVEAADRAQKDFEAQFSRREIPEHLEEFDREDLARVARDSGHATIVDALVASGICDSRSAARRLIEQRAVRVDEALVDSWEQAIDPRASFVLRAGRRMKRYRPTRQAGSAAT